MSPATYSSSAPYPWPSVAPRGPGTGLFPELECAKECERTKSTGHFGTCCSRASYLKARIASYNNALCFTSLAAHFDQARLGGHSRTPLFCVHGSSTRPRPPTLDLGLDGADSRIQRSTLTKLEFMLRTDNRFVREFASVKARAG
ncbi:BQ5605_C001g00015 [Microbotryum silenes-dioicae]|uniref:BQ5605_C001g00015 protein n=1 Tax=Microbotryum silenes-dioicae TaxID=796604 RepID=A0A2X0P4N5_9BASI|nr:BQ5605_C001g00015 [Microbotryum silenes-dioicae]